MYVESYDRTHSTTHYTPHTHTHHTNTHHSNHAYPNRIDTHYAHPMAHTYANHDAAECGTCALCGVVVGMR